MYFWVHMVALQLLSSWHVYFYLMQSPHGLIPYGILPQGRYIFGWPIRWSTRANVKKVMQTACGRVISGRKSRFCGSGAPISNSAAFPSRSCVACGSKEGCSFPLLSARGSTDSTSCWRACSTAMDALCACLRWDLIACTKASQNLTSFALYENSEATFVTAMYTPVSFQFEVTRPMWLSRRLRNSSITLPNDSRLSQGRP